MSDPLVECINFAFLPQKGYIYLLLTDKNKLKPQQYLRVLEIETPVNRNKSKSQSNLRIASNKNKTLLNYPLKKTGGVTDDLSSLTISSDCHEIYLYGKDYFRQWIISFNDKTAK